MQIREYFQTPRIINSHLSIAILVAGVLVSFGIAVQAQTSSPAEVRPAAGGGGITFPIPELGNCGSKDECLAYCNEPRNIPACVKFARERGLVNAEEAARAEKFSRKLSRGEGPGGCRSPQECRAFCNNLSNLEVCVKFAEEEGISNREVEEGKKILAYLRSGGQLPGGCNSKESCEKYCGDFSHAEECFNFAVRAGITQVRGEIPGEAKGRFEGGIPAGQFQKLLELVKKGETPGGCKSKEECENYCRSGDRLEECLAFAEKAGFVEPERAQKIRQSGGFGPGGCNSPDSCRRYCNDPAHREECFRFAEEHGFIKKEEIERAKEGLVHLRAGLEQAPPEVAMCLKSVLGTNIIEDIQSGNLTPGPEIGERVRQCQEKFGHKMSPVQIFSNAPPEVVACLKEKLGASWEKVRTGEIQPTPEVADTFRVCFNRVRFLEGGVPGVPGAVSSPVGQRMGMPEMKMPASAFYDFLKSAPPQIVSCIQDKLGDDYQKLKAGEIQPEVEIKVKIEECFKEFRPQLHLPQPPPRVREGLPGEPSKARPCPAMPTVGECPAGTERVKVFSSPECGDYYKCVGKNALPWDTRPGQSLCAQVITPAQDPLTGKCVRFPTPCDVPPGWKPGCENAPGGVQTVDPTKLLEPLAAPFVPQVVAPDTSTFTCSSLEECSKYCKDFASPYFKTPVCEKFRNESNISQ
jgi:hypothetical protein